MNDYPGKMRLLACACLLLPGCGAVPEASHEYSAFTQAPADRGRLIVYRLKSPPYVARTLVSAGGQSVKLPNNRFTYFDAAPGQHKVTTDWAWDAGVPDREATVTIHAGETKYLKIETTAAPLEGLTVVGMAAIPHVGTSESAIREIPAQEAKKELTFTRYAK